MAKEGERHAARHGVSAAPWRVGRKVGRTLYGYDRAGDERLIGLLDSPDDAAHAAACVNIVAMAGGLAAATRIIEADMARRGKRAGED